MTLSQPRVKKIASFTELFYALSETNSSDDKVSLIADYIRLAPERDLGWALCLLSGESQRSLVQRASKNLKASSPSGSTSKRAIKTRQLREWATSYAGIADWLFEESYGVVGDLAETIALLVGRADQSELGQRQTLGWSLSEGIELIEGLTEMSLERQRETIFQLWGRLSSEDILVFIKLLTGGLRIGVSKGLVLRAISRATGRSQGELMQQLAGEWHPERLTLSALSQVSEQAVGTLSPYPFFLAHPLTQPVEQCGSINEWRIEWKWDGIRAQIVKRGGELAIWSRGDELISESFPELLEAARELPDSTALDGEIVVSCAGQGIGTFFDLQKRLNRRTVSKRLLTELPARFICYDLLESEGVDLRALALSQRVAQLKQLFARLKSDLPLTLSTELNPASWSEALELRSQSRTKAAEGLMLKRLCSSYAAGRTSKGSWWKWKVDPLSVDAVLLYAQRGHGRRAGLFTDYTFGVWDGDKLVTFAKAYSGLTDAEIREVDAFIRRNTLERFGPVATVKPELVFEVAFESIQSSKRHRSGVAVRFPRIARWRKDKSAKEADTIESLLGLEAQKLS